MKKLLLLAVFFAFAVNGSALADDLDDIQEIPDEINAYVLKLAETGTPVQLREAVKAGYDFNVQGHIWDDSNDDYFAFDYETPLHRAAYYNHNPESIKYLISLGLDVNETASAGNTILESPLSCAIRSRNLEAVYVLLNAGADIETWCSGNNGSMFHLLASEYRHYNEIRPVIDALVKAGGNINSHYEFTPADKEEMFALEGESNFQIQWSRENPFGNKIYNLAHVSRDGFLASFTALMYAVLYDNPEAVNILLDYGADPDIKSLEDKTAYDYTKLLPKDSKIKRSSALKRLKDSTGLSSK